ncbi:MAG: PDZ domain-containing protein [Gemmatimonadota bacterium]
MTRRNVFIALGAALALLGTLPAAAQDRRDPEPRRPTVYRLDESRGWLGISMDWSNGPVVVDAVVPESPAARAGVARGDTVLRLDGAAADADAVRRLSPGVGDTVRLRLRRDGREREVRVVAGRREENVVILRRGDRVTVIDPDSVRERVAIRLDTIGAHLDSLFVRMDSLRVGTEARRLFRTLPVQLDSLALREWSDVVPFSIELGSRALAGAEFTQMNAGLGRYFQTEKGLLALRVAPGSPAARAGLESGDVVLRADGRDVGTLRELRAAVAGAEDAEAKLEVLRQGRRRELTLRWERGAEREVRVFRETVPARRPAPARRPVSH